MSNELVPTALVGGRFAKKEPGEPTVPPEPPSEVDPSQVNPLVPLLVTNSGTVDLKHLLAGPESIERVHAQLMYETQRWAVEQGRVLSNVVITWEVKLQAIASTPVLVMPDPTGQGGHHEGRPEGED